MFQAKKLKPFHKDNKLKCPYIYGHSCIYEAAVKPVQSEEMYLSTIELDPSGARTGIFRVRLALTAVTNCGGGIPFGDAL